MKYIPPSTGRSSFNCPHCHALAGQEWYILRAGKAEEIEQGTFVLTDAEERNVMEFIASNIPFLWEKEDYEGYEFELHNASIAKCFSCKYISFWVGENLIYPIVGNAPPPNSDLPDDIRRDYNEASSILDRSPRGAAALLRLAIQKLCKHLGQSGENINDDIAQLVSDGLDPRIQKALDAIRVIGNNAVHPGHIDLKDDRETGETLFHLVNVITDKMISGPKMIDQMYESLPGDVRRKIAKRDSKS